MSFETDIKKLQKLWDASQDNDLNQLATQADLFTQTQERINLFSLVTSIKSLIDKGGVWQNTVILETNGDNIIKGYQWSITIYNIPQDWIPFVRFNVGYQYKGDTDPIGIGTAKLEWFVAVKYSNPTDSNGKAINQNIVTATWNIGWSIQNNPSDFQMKLYLTVIPPINII